jgi:hypothetical protein
LVATAAGCGTIGALSLGISRPRYNEVIQQTTAEQLLLNIVRLRSGQTPLFLQVSTVTSQLSVAAHATALPTVQPSGNSSFGADVGASYTETPTITYLPLQGEQFAFTLLRRIPEEALITLLKSGWPLDLVLRVCVHRLGPFHNAPALALQTGPPRCAPEFSAVAELLQALQERWLIDLTMGPPVRNQARDRPLRPALWVAREAWATPEMQRLAALSPEPEFLRPTPEMIAAPEGGAFIYLEPTAGGHPGERRITLSTRTLIEVMEYLAAAIELPSQAQASRQPACEVPDFRVHSVRSAPKHTAVAVHHRGLWFYVDDGDVRSKATFLLLAIVFQLQAGKNVPLGPALTLPAGG